jgi:undecaprenyl-diphosphatase
MFQTFKEWDRELFIWLNNIGIEQYDAFWVFVTQIESWIPLFIFFFAIIFVKYGFKKGFVVIFFTIVTFGVTMTLTNLVKDCVARLRPNNVETLAAMIRILQKPTDFSFFSGHAASSFAVTTFIVLAIRKYTQWIYLAFIWPLTFVLSRIYVGVHYPSDLFVGALVGTMIAVFFAWACRKVLEKVE